MTNRAASGFTLIELLVVVVVIGLLAAIVLPNFVGAQQKAKLASVKSNMHALQTASESYAVDCGGLYATDPAQLGPYFPGGDNSAGGMSGRFGDNPMTNAPNETPAHCVINSIALVAGARTLAGNRNLGGSAGQTAYNGIPNPQNPSANYSYAVVGNNDAAMAIRTQDGFLVLSNM